jgi:hypothetical protein
MGVVAEAVITYAIVSQVVARRESKKWRPARLNVAKQLYLVHRTLFNAAKWVFDPDDHADKKGHRIPDSTSQAAADFWKKSQFVPGLEPTLNVLKKTVEYNNSALDSDLMPLVSDFLICAEGLMNCITFFLQAYNPNSTSPHHGFPPILGYSKNG